MEQRLEYQPTQNATAALSHPTDPSVQWSDQSAEDYKDALLEAFRGQSHLNEAQFERLGLLVRDESEVIVIPGVEPSTVEGYLFDIDLVPGAKPSMAQLPRMSPAEMAKERYHIEKEEALGHLRTPTDEQKSDWSCRCHVVNKKDDPMGRWICDLPGPEQEHRQEAHGHWRRA